MYQRKFKVLPSDALVSIYPAMPQASTSTRFDIFFVFKCWITRRTLRKVLLRESANTNGFKPVRTWFCATRFSAAPAASYYFTIDQTFWPIYGPRAGCLLKNKERFMCVCLYLQWGNIGTVGPISPLGQNDSMTISFFWKLQFPCPWWFVWPASPAFLGTCHPAPTVGTCAGSKVRV